MSAWPACAYLQDVADIEDRGIAALAISDVNSIGLIISLANRHRLPSIFSFRYYPTDGGLASYDVDLVDLYRRAAGYIDRVLRGEHPAELPI